MWSLLPDINRITLITGWLKAIVVLIYQCDFIYLFIYFWFCVSFCLTSDLWLVKLLIFFILICCCL